MEKNLCAVIITLGIYSLLKDSGLLTGKYRVGFLGYYTILSNFLVLFYFREIISSHGLLQQWVRRCDVSLAVTLTITVTFLIYHFMLHPGWVRLYKEGRLDTPYTLKNLSLHYIIPVLTIVYWIVFADKSGLKYVDGIKWLIIPVIYLAYLWLRKLLKISAPVFIHGYYPYDFLNVDDYGIRQVIINVIILMNAFGLLGIIMVAIARFLLKGI
ncbi:MAG: Pr6Pr family membrane protein [Erysipelotrichaceae bacterium]|nr:Pr6Pr family membrane protein [Erysipelotrichaceae bacterium]